MSKSRKNMTIIAALYFALVLLLGTSAPVVNFFDRIEPYVFGFMPFSQFYILLFAVLMAGGLSTFYLLEVRLLRKEYQGVVTEKEADEHE